MDAFFERLSGRKTTSAGNAKDRLKLVLINDRTDLTPEAMNHMKDEIITVISKYINFETKEVRISVENEGREQRLVADIPLLPVRRKR